MMFEHHQTLEHGQNQSGLQNHQHHDVICHDKSSQCSINATCSITNHHNVIVPEGLDRKARGSFLNRVYNKHRKKTVKVGPKAVKVEQADLVRVPHGPHLQIPRGPHLRLWLELNLLQIPHAPHLWHLWLLLELNLLKIPHGPHLWLRIVLLGCTSTRQRSID